MGGFGSWGYGYGKGSKKKKFWSSTSGWEDSHFGGYTRIIMDYPYIKFDWKATINVPSDLRTGLGVFHAEKLIKMYLMKCKEAGYLQHLERKKGVRKNLIGRETEVDILSLNRSDVLDAVMKKFTEFAPLFEEYKDQILATEIHIEAPLPQQGGGGQGEGEGEEGEGQGEEGEGQGEGEGEGQGGEGEGEGEGQGGQGEGEGDGEGNAEGKSKGKGKGEGKGKPKGSGGGWGGSSSSAPDFKEIERVLNEMTEQLPFSSMGRLGAECKPVFVTLNKDKKNRDYDFSDEEKRNADMILKQLDISFDPKSDEVKNLKLGKLDTSKLAEVPAGNISVYKQTLEDQDTKAFAVCVLADMSGSMQGHRLETQFRVLNSLYLALSEIIPEEDLHIYGHSGDDIEPKIYTFCNPYHTDYRKNIQDYFRISNQSNYDGIVIEQVHKKIREKTDRPVILVSLSDGQPCDSTEDMKRILERARRDQFVTVGIGIGTDYVKHLYTYSRIVSDEKITEMPREVAGIINHVVKTEFK
jgi:hypothetical protein